LCQKEMSCAYAVDVGFEAVRWIYKNLPPSQPQLLELPQPCP
jgi:hypothetical protein